MLYEIALSLMYNGPHWEQPREKKKKHFLSATILIGCLFKHCTLLKLAAVIYLVNSGVGSDLSASAILKGNL